MTVEEIIAKARTNPMRFFDFDYLEGEVYVVNFTSNEIKIQAVYSGELVRNLPKELLETAKINSSGYTNMHYWNGGKYTLTVTLT